MNYGQKKGGKGRKEGWIKERSKVATPSSKGGCIRTDSLGQAINVRLSEVVRRVTTCSLTHAEEFLLCPVFPRRILAN